MKKEAKTEPQPTAAQNRNPKLCPLRLTKLKQFRGFGADTPLFDDLDQALAFANAQGPSGVGELIVVLAVWDYEQPTVPAAETTE